MIGLVESLLTSKLPNVAQPANADDAATATTETATQDGNFLSMLYQMLVAPTAPPVVHAEPPIADATTEQQTLSISSREVNDAVFGINEQTKQLPQLSRLSVEVTSNVAAAFDGAKVAHEANPEFSSATIGLQTEQKAILKANVETATMADHSLETIQDVASELKYVSENAKLERFEESESKVNGNVVRKETDTSENRKVPAAIIENVGEKPNTNFQREVRSIEVNGTEAEKKAESVFAERKLANEPIRREPILTATNVVEGKQNSNGKKISTQAPLIDSAVANGTIRTVEYSSQEGKPSDSVRANATGQQVADLFSFGISFKAAAEIQAVADKFATVLPKTITWQPIEVATDKTTRTTDSSKLDFNVESKESPKVEADVKRVALPETKSNVQDEQTIAEKNVRPEQNRNESQTTSEQKAAIVLPMNSEKESQLIRDNVFSTNVEVGGNATEYGSLKRENSEKNETHSNTAESDPTTPQKTQSAVTEKSNLKHAEGSSSVVAESAPKAVSFEPTMQNVKQDFSATMAENVPVARQEIPHDFARNLVVKISDELRAHIEGRTSEVRVVMKPESLGEISLRVSMDDGKLAARLDVSQPAVRSALEAQLPQLRNALATQGIDVQRFDIVSSGEKQFQHSHDGAASRQHAQTKRSMNVDVAENFEQTKFLGYNTVEYII